MALSNLCRTTVRAVWGARFRAFSAALAGALSLAAGTALADSAPPAVADSAPTASPAPASPAPASPAPAAPAAPDVATEAVNSLLYDVSKIVEVQASSGWKIDRYEYEKMMPDTLLSVCRTTDEIRSFALAEMSRRITRLGGPLEEALRKNGNRVEDLEDLLFATRVEHTLAEAVRRAPSECPLWVTPKTDFRSIQTGVDRFVLTAEGGGTGLLQYSAVHPAGTTGFTLGGGGGGRLMLGRGFGHAWSLRTGPEVSVVALVRRDKESTSLPLQFMGAIPVILRYNDISWHYNLELAPLGMFTEDDPVVRYGFRFGLMIGISALQVRSFIPWAGIGGAIEAFPDAGTRPLLVNLKGGVRAGLDWDF